MTPQEMIAFCRAREKEAANSQMWCAEHAGTWRHEPDVRAGYLKDCDEYSAARKTYAAIARYIEERDGTR